MEERLMEERKNMLLDLMKDPTYVPMKLKELAMLLGVTKEQRGELEEVLNELVKGWNLEKGKICEIRGLRPDGSFCGSSPGLRLCDYRGQGG